MSRNPLDGTFIMPMAVSGPTRSEMKDLIPKLGASLESRFSNRTTHVVTEDPKSPRIKQALEHKVPVVSPDWVKQCYEKGKHLPETDFPAAGIEGVIEELEEEHPAE